jgi:hypothetical protein
MADNLEVSLSFRRPDLAVTEINVLQMPEREFGADACVVGLIEVAQPGGRLVAGFLDVSVEYPFTDLRRTQPFTFQRQEAELRRSIKNPEVSMLSPRSTSANALDCIQAALSKATNSIA